MPTAARLHWVLSTAASTVPPPVPGLGATAAPGWLPVRRGCLKASGPWNLWSLESLTYDPQKDVCVCMCVYAHACAHTEFAHHCRGQEAPQILVKNFC